MKKSIINKKIQAKLNKKSTLSIKDNLDSDILFQIKKYLKKKYHIPTNQIRIGHSIKFTDNDCKIMGKLTYIKISNITKSFLVHTPDIIITDKNETPKLIIEQDGKIHDDDKIMIKDQKRNKHYVKARIPFIIINSKKLRTSKKTYQVYLDEEIEKTGINLYLTSS